MGSLRVEAANPSGWSYASALRSANLNPFQYRILKGTKMLDPNHVLAEKLPLRFKREDFDEQGELHLGLVRADEDVDYGAASDDDDRGAPQVPAPDLDDAAMQCQDLFGRMASPAPTEVDSSDDRLAVGFFTWARQQVEPAVGLTDCEPERQRAGK